MKKLHFFNLLVALFLIAPQVSAVSSELPKQVLEETWQEFRNIHPFGYQTVALKHVGNECVFVISEPAETVKQSDIAGLFAQYGGAIEVKHQPLGYDGWLADVVGSVKLENEVKFKEFENKLFVLLYGTDYKAYYTDLDNPAEHVYFSDYRLNYSISAAELYKWFLKDNEQFNVGKTTKTINGLLTSVSNPTNELYFSKDRGFVVWVVAPDKIESDYESFKLNARKFALDTDLIIGAIGNIGKKVAIIARERVVPVEVLPPLRIETLVLLATTGNDHLAQSFEMYNVFAGKTENGTDMAPIYLSDELWHTEYGNLLNMTDQMLKSWTENGDVRDYNYNYPTPIDWAFNDGVFRDLSLSNSLTYNWNTAGAGYVIQDIDGLDIYAVNRTGSLPVSFIPEGMEGKVDEKVNEAEELAYDFFSELNSPELVREVQYATVYQIFRYFKDPNKKQYSYVCKNAPSFEVYDSIIADLLRVVADTSAVEFKQKYNAGLKRFEQKFNKTSIWGKMKELLKKDPYGEYRYFIDSYLEESQTQNLLRGELTSDVVKMYFDEMLYPRIDTIKKYMDNYSKKYGSFPYSEAASYFVSSKVLNAKDVEPEGSAALDREIVDYNDKVHAYNDRLEKYNELLEQAKKEVYSYNSNTKETEKLVELVENEEKNLTRIEKELAVQYDKIEVQQKKLEKQREQNIKEYGRQLELRPTVDLERALGAINWLLTDSYPYDSPIGPYYASKFTSHGHWLKSSPVTCSNYSGHSMYGGHNLDAGITHIKLGTKTTTVGKVIPKDYCCVTIKDGTRVINVAKADKARVTPSLLRAVERKNIGSEIGEMYKLPKAPMERPKVAIIGKSEPVKMRGLDLTKSKPIIEKKAFVDGVEVKSSAELKEIIANDIAVKGKSPVKEIKFKDYSAREVHAYADELKECIIQRAPNESINLKSFNINEDIVIEKQSDGTIKMMFEQNPNTLPVNNKIKSGKLEITLPEMDENAAKSAIEKVYNKPEKSINNGFKWKRELKLELQKTNPGIDSYDIKEEYKLLFGYIRYEKENVFVYAA